MILLLIIITILCGLFVIAMTIHNRLRASHRRALLQLIALGVERSIPLPGLVASFGKERWGFYREHVMELAAILERGVLPAQAIFSTPKALPYYAPMAALLGEQTGAMASALRQSLDNEAFQKPLWRDLGGRLFYFFFVFAWIALFFTFLIFIIVPAFKKIFDDFGTQLPGLTLFLINVSQLFLNVAVFLVLPLLVGMLIAVCSYIGWLRLRLPGFGWLMTRLDSAVVLRSLALAAERNQPLLPVLQALQQEYPQPSVCRRLGRAVTDIQAGRDWRGSLKSQNLLGAADSELLHSAELAGNLPWAMRETAEACERRTILRAEAILQIVSPIVVIGLGIVVLTIGVGFLSPLAKLIWDLSR